MGAYSPLPWLPAGFVDEVIDTIALPTIRQLATEQKPFIGLLYCGLILTSKGIRVIEFNARFGDPETQVVLPRLVTPLSGLLFAAATGGLGSLPRPEFSDEVAVTVVLASEGYPEDPITGRRIAGLDRRAGCHDRPRLDRGVRRRAARHRRSSAERRRARRHLCGGTRKGVRRARPHFTAGRPLPHRYRREGVMSELAGWDHIYSGKVRDLYTSPDHPDRVLMVASDRVSAFDHVLEPAIPGKGALLTELSLWWFDQLDSVPNHLAPQDEWSVIPAEVADRAMLVTRLEMFPIECVVRGYLSGSGWVEYQQTQSVCGVPLPAGLTDGDRLPQAIFTPAWKAPAGQHDENITLERAADTRRPRQRQRPARPLARDLRPRIRYRGVEGDHPRRHQVRVRIERGWRAHPRRRGAHHRQQPVLGCRGVRLRAIAPRASTSRSCATG